MNKTPKRGSWLIGAALLVAVALSAVALHAWRERGAWLRTPPGREHLCVQLEGDPVTDPELEMFQLLLKARGQFMDLPVVEFETVRSEPSTTFRSAYLQFAVIRRGGVQREAFDGMLPEGGTRIRRAALVNAQGEVVRLEP